MKPRRLIWFIIGLLIFGMSVSGYASDKKGIGLADLHAAARINELNVSWYYTWSPHPIYNIPPEKFVPMVSGPRYRLGSDIAAMKLKGKVPVLLSINEPNKRDQANLSVESVVRWWPEIQDLADRVSSPAPAGVLGPWFDKFFRTARARGLRFDFMAIHVYGPPDADKFLAKIDAVYKKYQLPIWVTEFAVADWKAKKRGSNRYSEGEVLRFMKEVLPELEKRPYVERYAWFGAGKHSLNHEQVYTSRLFDKNGELTPLGQFYAKFHAEGRSD